MSHASLGRRGVWCAGCRNEPDDCTCAAPAASTAPLSTTIAKPSCLKISDDVWEALCEEIQAAMKYNPPPPTPEEIEQWRKGEIKP